MRGSTGAKPMFAGGRRRSGAMTKADLIEGLSNKLGINKDEAEKAVNIVLDDIIAALKAGERVNISGFGTFAVSDARRRGPGAIPRPANRSRFRPAARRSSSRASSSRIRSMICRARSNPYRHRRDSGTWSEFFSLLEDRDRNGKLGQLASRTRACMRHIRGYSVSHPILIVDKSVGMRDLRQRFEPDRGGLRRFPSSLTV